MGTTHTSHTRRAATDAPFAGPPPVGAGPGGRRVREEARDQVVVMAFSALASCGVAVLLMLLVQVAG